MMARRFKIADINHGRNRHSWSDDCRESISTTQLFGKPRREHHEPFARKNFCDYRGPTNGSPQQITAR
jgi:hypothetical protein